MSKAKKTSALRDVRDGLKIVAAGAKVIKRDGLKAVDVEQALNMTLRPARFRQGLALRALRLERGLTLQEVAERTGMSLSTVQAFEVGRGKNYNVILKHTLADFYGVNFFDLWPEERERIEQIMGKGRQRPLFNQTEGQGANHK